MHICFPLFLFAAGVLADIAMWQTVVSEDLDDFLSFMNLYGGGDVVQGYTLVNGTINMLIHDPDTYAIIHKGEFGNNGQAEKYIEQVQRSMRGSFSGEDNSTELGKANHTDGMQRRAAACRRDKLRPSPVLDKRGSRCGQFCSRGPSCTQAACPACRYVPGGGCSWQLSCQART